MKALTTESLTKKYGKKEVVRSLNLQLEEGEIYGFLGNNGAGKTTTMKMIVGLTPITSGQINMFGEPQCISKHLKRVGTTIEAPGFYGSLTAEENLWVFMRLHGLTNKKIIDELLLMGGLKEVRHQKVKTFSMGMKQRLAIVRALMHDPDLLILDEPINGLDPNGILETRELLLRLKAEKGVTMMISSHILAEVEQLVDRIGIVHQGALLEETDMATFRKKRLKRMELQVDQPDVAIRVLQEKWGIHARQNQRGGLFINDVTHPSAGINQSLVESGIGVSRLWLQEESMEDYFMSLTNGRGQAC